MTMIELFFVGLFIGLALYSLSYVARLQFVAALGVVMLIASASVLAAPEPWQLQETRYCGAPARNADGSIKRSTAVLNAFKRIHPCPVNGMTTGACPGWAIDHIIPLAACGCDSIPNLQWLKNEIKSCPGEDCKDRWERKINFCLPEDASPSASSSLPPQSAASSALVSSMPFQ